MLSLAFAFHLSQLAFLTLVEVPHVDKLYSPAREHKPDVPWLQRMWQLSGIPQFDITSDSEVAQRHSGSYNSTVALLYSC